ncbi:malonyl-CoA decarboxylase [Ferruginivarius sediminum]|uniref:malonyl-CoA decarboxylase n=1 Tax=Ferruginivarius sediminum TaxID=2661937 RepID=UPI001F4E69B3|nr:malonyl-CoA decarboxylase [Ferruginivarius sediminum]
MELLFRRKLAPGSDGENIYTLCNELLSTLGEASGTAIARKVIVAYEAMDAEARCVFFEKLRRDFNVDAKTVLDAANAYAAQSDDASLAKLIRAVEPPRQELFRRLNMAPNGTESLVRMRRDLLETLRDKPELKAVDADLRHLFASWFNRGFLALRRIDWETPAAVLEKLIEYETVHEMRGWDDLRRRLAPDRRCFAFFHSALPNDPLVFVEVALVKGISGEIGPIISLDRVESDPASADTAIFYSINNCHEGLRGITFGNFLIKQVVLELAREFPQLKTYATLSPVPGFRHWLSGASKPGADPELLTDAEIETLVLLGDSDWSADATKAEALQPLLTRLIAHYLLHEKRGSEPLDPVARFHLRNGARLDRINWLGDCSLERMRQSAGFLVNYVYDLKSIERNHEDYVKNHMVVASSAVTRLAQRKGK